MFLEILLTLFLVFLNGFFVAAEFAIVKVRSSQIETKGHSNIKVSTAAKTILAHLDSYLAATQLGITLASLGLGWVGEEVVSGIIINIVHSFNLSWSEQTAHNIALPFAFLTITVLHIVFGELAPKSLAIRHPSRTTFAVALPLRFFYFVFRPFIFLLNGFANFLLRLIGIRPIHGSEIHTEEELKVIIQESAESGAIQEIEQTIVDRVFALGDREVDELMTHRSDLLCLDINDSLNDVKAKVALEIHSVYPVINGSLDELLGVISVKELFPKDLNAETFTLNSYIRKPIFLHENTPVYKALERFKKEKLHNAIIVDEYGAIKGMLAMDDVLGALLGDVSSNVQDDYTITAREDGTWLADGQVPYFEFIRFFNLEDEEDGDFNTLAGFVLNKLHHIPASGEKLKWSSFEFEIVDMDGRRIDKILIKKTMRSV
jgi:CBS domain containing-hemolysin-like protein